MTPLEELNVEEALWAAYEAGREVAHKLMRAIGDSEKRAVASSRTEHEEAVDKAEVNALKTLSQLGQTYASISEAIARGMQSRRNQL